MAYGIMDYQIVTWPMTLLDPRRCCEVVRLAILATAWLLVIQWRHSFCCEINQRRSAVSIVYVWDLDIAYSRYWDVVHFDSTECVESDFVWQRNSSNYWTLRRNGALHHGTDATVRPLAGNYRTGNSAVGTWRDVIEWTERDRAARYDTKSVSASAVVEAVSTATDSLAPVSDYLVILWRSGDYFWRHAAKNSHRMSIWRFDYTYCILIRMEFIVNYLFRFSSLLSIAGNWLVADFIAFSMQQTWICADTSMNTYLVVSW